MMSDRTFLDVFFFSFLISVVFEILPLLSRHFYRNRLGVTSLREGVGDMVVCDRFDRINRCWLSLVDAKGFDQLAHEGPFVSCPNSLMSKSTSLSTGVALISIIIFPLTNRLLCTQTKSI